VLGPPVRTPSRLVATVAIAIAAVAVTVAIVTGAPVAQAQGRQAVVVSDSILLGAQAPLVGNLQGAGFGVEFDGTVSRSTLAGAEAVRSHAAALTDTLVISLGANDSGNPGTFRQRVDAVMVAAAGVPNVYWITIREVRPYYAPANQVLRDAAARYPNLHIVDWHAASAGRAGLTSSDGLHLTPAGARELADLLTGAIVSGSVPAAEAPPTTVPAPPSTTAPVPDAVPAPAPAEVAPPTTVAPTTGTPTAAVVALDRSLFVTGDLPGRSVSAVAAPAPPAPGLPWAWILVVLALLGGTAVAFRQLGLRTASGPVRHAPLSRSQLRAARIAGARDRHPTTGTAPPVPVEPGPELQPGVAPSELSGTGAEPS
jgi:lysophospholipase L1-like esterase